MKTLGDVCRRLIAGLEQRGEAVETARADLARFEKEAVLWPVRWIELRLQRVRLGVLVEAVQQSLHHDGKGIVSIVTRHDGHIFVTWEEDESSLTEAIKSWEAPWTQLAEEEFFAFMDELLEQLHDGDWEPAVRWLQAHGISVAPLKAI